MIAIFVAGVIENSQKFGKYGQSFTKITKQAKKDLWPKSLRINKIAYGK